MRTQQVVMCVTVVGLLALLAGCQLDPPLPQARPDPPAEFFQDPLALEARPVHLMQLPGYRLNFGDELEIIYQVRTDRTDTEYKLQIEDRVNIRFPFQVNLNQTMQIPSDGLLHLLLLDKPVQAVGKTASQLRAELHQLYSQQLLDPQFTVVIEQANAKVEELRRMITTSPRGQSRLVPVAPDGRISLPFAYNVMAFGLTIPELIDTLNHEYRAAGIEGVEVSVNILNVAPIKVYVMGEVLRPGLINLRHHPTLTQAIATAGGVIRGRAESTKVLLVRRRGMKVPTGAVINAHYLTDGLGIQAENDQQIDFAAHRFDPFLQDEDIIYVPSTQLAKNADWIRIVFTENIYRVLPFSGSGTYNVNENVDWLRPN